MFPRAADFVSTNNNNNNNNNNRSHSHSDSLFMFFLHLPFCGRRIPVSLDPILGHTHFQTGVPTRKMALGTLDLDNYCRHCSCFRHREVVAVVRLLKHMDSADSKKFMLLSWWQEMPENITSDVQLARKNQKIAMWFITLAQIFGSSNDPAILNCCKKFAIFMPPWQAVGAGGMALK